MRASERVSVRPCGGGVGLWCWERVCVWVGFGLIWGVGWFREGTGAGKVAASGADVNMSLSTQ